MQTPEQLELTHVTQEHMDQQIDTTTQVDHDISTTNNLTTNTVKFDHPTVIAKMTELHEHVDLLHFTLCELCQENFPNLQVNAQQRYK